MPVDMPKNKPMASIYLNLPEPVENKYKHPTNLDSRGGGILHSILQGNCAVSGDGIHTITQNFAGEECMVLQPVFSPTLINPSSFR